MTVGPLESTGFADVFKFAITEIVINHVRRARKAAWATHDRGAFPHATDASARFRSCREIEVHVVGDDEIEFAVAVIVDEGAAGSPLFAGAGDSGSFGDLFEGAIALIVEEAILAIAGDVKVVEAVVVIITDADSLAPADGSQACTGSDVSERTIVVVVEEVTGWFFFWVGGVAGQRGPVDEEDVGPAVAIVVDDCHARACGFEDVTLGIDTSIDVADSDTRFGGYIDEPSGRWVVNGGWIGLLCEGAR